MAFSNRVKKMNITVIIAAAGLGRRLKAKERKPFIKLGRCTILERTVQKFADNKKINKILVAVHKNDLDRTKQLLLGFKKVKNIICGGKKRGASVMNCIDKLSAEDEIVLIHDAARPFFSADLINLVIAETKKWGAVVPVVNAASTIKKVAGGFVKETVDRKNMFLAQTPQGFKVNLYKKILKENRKIASDITDDALLFEIGGRKVRAVKGESANIKITTKDDLQIAEALAVILH